MPSGTGKTITLLALIVAYQQEQMKKVVSHWMPMRVDEQMPHVLRRLECAGN
jgi:Rad3-related DNA helicase